MRDAPRHSEIDYVRVYQPLDKIQVGCDPPSHPTKQWIREHADEYRFEHMETSLRGVEPGGGSCAQDEDCGGTGECTRGACLCLDGNWTGPHCLSQAAGDARACRPLEDAAQVIEAEAARRYANVASLILGRIQLNSAAASQRVETRVVFSLLTTLRGHGAPSEGSSLLAHTDTGGRSTTPAACWGNAC